MKIEEEVTSKSKEGDEGNEERKWKNHEEKEVDVERKGEWEKERGMWKREDGWIVVGKIRESNGRERRQWEKK